MSTVSLATPLFPVLKSATDAANAVALQIKAATSGKDEKVQAILSTSDDAEIVKFREDEARINAQIAAAKAKIEEARAAVVAKAESLVSDDFDVEKGKAEFLVKRQEVTSIRKTILVLLGNDEKALAKAIEENGITEILSLRGSSGKTSGAVGKRKPRLASATVNGEDQGEKVSFTTLASKIGIDVDVLKDAAFAAAGTDDLKTVAGTEVSFSVTNKKNETVEVVVVPKGDAVSEEETSEEVSEETDES